MIQQVMSGNISVDDTNADDTNVGDVNIWHTITLTHNKKGM